MDPVNHMERGELNSANSSSLSDSDLTASDIEDICGEAVSKLLLFHKMLSTEGEVRGLIGPDESARLWTRHILNSAALLIPLSAYKEHEKEAGKGKDSYTIADVGSGAGFPGIVLSCFLPQDRFTLIEPMERRCLWLEEVIRTLSLGNVTVVRARAEEYKEKDFFDVVTCRAVAPLKTLVPWVFPLIRRHGELIALKGKSVDGEIRKAAKEIRAAGGYNPRSEEISIDPRVEKTYVAIVDKS